MILNTAANIKINLVIWYFLWFAFLIVDPFFLCSSVDEYILYVRKIKMSRMLHLSLLIVFCFSFCSDTFVKVAIYKRIMQSKKCFNWRWVRLGLKHVLTIINFSKVKKFFLSLLIIHKIDKKNREVVLLPILLYYYPY